MIDVFVCDIDGCLAEPYAPYELDELAKMANYAKQAGHGGSIRPPVSLCSGRPYSYVEAMSQVLGLTLPVLFESGGGMFDPVSTRTVWNPAFTDELEEAIGEVRRWMDAELVPESGMKLDYDKRTQAGVLSPRTEEILEAYPKVQKHLERYEIGLNAYRTDVSIDVVAPGITKSEGLAWLAEELGTEMERVAYIGDTNGDIPALQQVGHSFAPVNSTSEVKDVVQRVMDEPVIRGTLAAYEECMKRNEGQNHAPEQVKMTT